MTTQMCSVCQGTGNITICGDDGSEITMSCPGQCGGSGQVEVPDQQ